MKRISIAISTLLVALTCGISSCKKDYDPPPETSGYDPMLPVTHTISQLLNLPQGSVIDADVVVSGIVVMDDRSGNYYKKMVIQDSTGGIEILIDQNNLYNDYPVGRKVYVKCKGLYLGAYGGNPQMGYTPDATGSLSNIPAVLVSDYIVKANYPNPIVPDTLTLAELAIPSNAKKYWNTLVAVKQAEFAIADAGVPYAQLASLASATNLTIYDCSGGSIKLRSSGYAKFQPYLTPTGNGTIVGVYTHFASASKDEAQLYIRDTTDVRFTGTRCDGTTPAPAVVITVDSLRKMFTGSEIVLPSVKIRGVVISDKDNGNVSNGNVIFQGGDNDKGVILYYGGTPPYALGDSLEVTLTGTTLKLYNGKMEVEDVTTSKTVKLASNRSITPKVVTVATLNANIGQYESTLVRIQNVSFSGGTTFNGAAGNLTVTDASGSLKHYCTLSASFRNETLPASPAAFIMGYVDQFSGSAQIRMRKRSDAP